MSDIVERLRDMDEPLRERERLEIVAEIERLKAQNAEAAAFLDGMAERMATPEGFFVEAVVRDCRAMAAKLRALEDTK
jgi:hypothetical protein